MYLQFLHPFSSVTGLSIDFVIASVIGFLCYSVFTVSFYFIPFIQDEYKRAHDGQVNLIQFNDVFFAVHAFVLTSLYTIQVLMYRKKEEKMSIAGAVSCGGVCVGLVVLTGLCVFNLFSWLSLMYVMSYVKLVLTVIKYIPQVYMNYVLKSTVGWHVQNVILDLVGGVLSIAQLFLDAFSSGDISGIKGYVLRRAFKISNFIVIELPLNSSWVWSVLYSMLFSCFNTMSGSERLLINVSSSMPAIKHLNYPHQLPKLLPLKLMLPIQMSSKTAKLLISCRRRNWKLKGDQ